MRRIAFVSVVTVIAVLALSFAGCDDKVAAQSALLTSYRLMSRTAWLCIPQTGGRGQ